MKKELGGKVLNLFKNRVFTTILFTDIIQQAAIWIRNISVMFFIMDVTNKDPMAISALNFVDMVPMFLLTFLGGIIADKYNPKKLMFLGDFLSFISFVILGSLISKGYMVAIFITVLISAIVTQFSYPASQKYFKEYVDEKEIDLAIGISQLLASIFPIIGPFLGSYFYFTFGIGKTLLIIAFMFLLSVALIITLPNKQFEKIESDGFIEDARLTFNYVNNKKVIKVFAKMLFILSFGIGISGNLDIFLITERLGLNEEFYQFFSGIAGIGAVVGGLLYIAISKYLKDMKIVYSLIGVFSITVFLEGYSTLPVFTMILQFIDNVIGALLSGYVMTLMTKITDQEYLGKVNGLTSTLMYFGLMISFVLSGVILKYSSIVIAFSLASFTFVVCFIMLYREIKRGLLDDLNN